MGKEGVPRAQKVERDIAHLEATGFDIDTAFNTRGFLEFLAAEPDAETFDMQDSEEIAKRFKTFEAQAARNKEMEEHSSFERVVGKISEAEKAQILRDKGERFDDQVFEEMKGKEREKTPEELEMISLANAATNEIRQKYGLEDFNIPPDNIHVIHEEAWPKEKSTAFYNSMFQGIAMREALSKVAFAKTSFHEMVHFKSYNAAQITTGGVRTLSTYRVGLTVDTRDGRNRYFTNLNEAVTEELAKRYAKTLFSNPLFTKELKQSKRVIERYPGAVTDSGKPLFNDETFYAEVEGKKTWRDAVGRLFGRLPSSNVRISAEHFSYPEERHIMHMLIDKILEKNPEKFQDKEEVFDVFAKGMMTGNILPVGRLIEKTFGNGTFRRIGELDDDIEAQQAFVHLL